METTFNTQQAILIFVSLINEKYIFYRPFRDPKVPKGLYYRPRSVNTDHLGTLYYVLPLMFLGLCHQILVAIYTQSKQDKKNKTCAEFERKKYNLAVTCYPQLGVWHCFQWCLKGQGSYWGFRGRFRYVGQFCNHLFHDVLYILPIPFNSTRYSAVFTTFSKISLPSIRLIWAVTKFPDRKM